jgi:hypothetical protein
LAAIGPLSPSELHSLAIAENRQRTPKAEISGEKIVSPAASRKGKIG